MQISTRREDYIVDTLKLWDGIVEYLQGVFVDPTIRKVMHGADRDILWLQRDFHIYVCNMFDTQQASKVLKLERNSLEYLLGRYCDIEANKECQNADWRLRPLTDEMMRYGREQTHYLLYIYDRMERELLSSSTDLECPEALLEEVYRCSSDVCMQLYEKQLVTENSYLSINGLAAAGLSSEQLAIVAGLFNWRDLDGRVQDESTHYILPDEVLIEIAKKKPDTRAELSHITKSRHPYIELRLGLVLSIVRWSTKNAGEFQGAANKLKEDHLKMIKLEKEKEVRNVGDQMNKLDGSCASIVGVAAQGKPSGAFEREDAPLG